MNKMIVSILSLFKRRKQEYVYVFTLDSTTVNVKVATSKDDKYKFTSDNSHSEKMEKIRVEIFSKVLGDVTKMKKEIKFSDYLTDTKSYKTTYVLATDSLKTNQFLYPAMYEIYAYQKLKKDDIFSFPFEKLLFKSLEQEIEVLKLKVEC